MFLRSSLFIIPNIFHHAVITGCLQSAVSQVVIFFFISFHEYWKLFSITAFLCNFFSSWRALKKRVQTCPPVRLLIIACNYYPASRVVFYVYVYLLYPRLYCVCVCVCLTDRPLVITGLRARNGPLHHPAQCWMPSRRCSYCPQSAQSECRRDVSQERCGNISLKQELSVEKKMCQA